MDISKTMFKEYSKCQRVYPLKEIYSKKLAQKVNLFNDDRNEQIIEILSNIFDEETGEDLIAVDDTQIIAMAPFYQDVERLAIEFANDVFQKEFHFYSDTKEQEYYSFTDKQGYRFYCYLDGYNEDDNEIIVIEVKSITSTKVKELGPKINGQVQSIFKLENHIYHLISEKEWEYGLNKYQDNYQKLFDKNHSFGKYVYDLAIERYIVENSRLESKAKKKKIKYYLGILNSDFVMPESLSLFNGDNSVICYVDLTDVTEKWLGIIEKIKDEIEETIINNTLVKQVYNKNCGFSSRDKCIFYPICWKEYLEHGSSLEYMEAKFFYDEENRKISTKEIIDLGYKKIDDISLNWIKNKNQLIQRNCYVNNIEYIDKEKIKMGLDCLKYPIYHLDFEAFNSPIPRFTHEKPFSQSVFQFSIHIEKEVGKCDLKKDNYYYVASTFDDERKKLVEKMIEIIDLKKGGTVLVYNASFEYNRILEFIDMFPEYQNELKLILEHMVDLENIVHKGKKFYENLGLDSERASQINFYNNMQIGKYSIKKLLPVFSDLSYSDLNIYNGVIASCSYSKFKYLDKEDIEEIRKDLIEYCGQDTWSMVLILKGLRKRII